MHKFARLWIFCATDKPGAELASALLRTTSCIPALQLVVAAPGPACGAAADELALALRVARPLVRAALAQAAPDESTAAAATRVARELDRLAADAGGGHVAICAERSVVALVLARVLGIDERRAASVFSLDPAHCVALDWPAVRDEELRPAVIGVGLDWLPPGPPERAARFPGGPGSAPSRRG